ncbi:hypothetical protein FHU38_003687 [Saccharomonospora amisosensis]|uniref:Uncharacterized protein n=1 Tax=Saccharomonospora amisosensis TaxID=1128677 RepID=A0A7X5ZRY6_9PSEU|nr:hypothetical protein [Saccharomonospora amisosensis]
MKCLYLVTRNLDPTGTGRAGWMLSVPRNTDGYARIQVLVATLLIMKCVVMARRGHKRGFELQSEYCLRPVHDRLNHRPRMGLD